MKGEFHEIRWSWTSSDVDARRTACMGVDGRVSIAELVAKMRELAPNASLDEIGLNWATVTWTREATPEERAEREEREANHQRRKEAWERKTLAELTAKYGSPEPSIAERARAMGITPRPIEDVIVGYGTNPTDE